MDLDANTASRIRVLDTCVDYWLDLVRTHLQHVYHIQFGVTSFSLALAIFLPIKDIPAEFSKYMCIAYATSIAISTPDIIFHINDKNYDFVKGIVISDSLLAIFSVINFVTLKEKLPNKIARPDQ